MDSMTITEVEAAISGNAENKKNQSEFIYRVTWEQTRWLAWWAAKHNYKGLSSPQKMLKFSWDGKSKKTPDIQKRLEMADKIFPKTLKHLK